MLTLISLAGFRRRSLLPHRRATRIGEAFGRRLDDASRSPRCTRRDAGLPLGALVRSR
jgi:hypothetical protein